MTRERLHTGARTGGRPGAAPGKTPAARPAFVLLSALAFFFLLCAARAPARAALNQDPTEGSRFYPARYYPGVADSTSATAVVLAPGDSALLEIPMDAMGGTIRGRVLAPGATPLTGVLVVASSGGLRTMARTGADGRFVLAGVPPGGALVRYATDQPQSYEIRYLALYYPGVSDSAQAARISVSGGETVTLNDVILPQAARLGGTVYLGESEAPMAEADVRILSPSEPDWYRAARTSGTGRFLVGGLPSGSYIVQALPGSAGYIPEFFGGAREASSAGLVQAVAGEERLDLVIRPDSGSAMWGEIRREDGTGVPGVLVRAAGEDGKVYTGITQELGHYRIIGLPSGEYIVDVPALKKYYPDTYFRSQARPVRVIEPADVFHIDMRGSPGPCLLAPGQRGAISGAVWGDFTGVQRAVVRAFSETDTVETELEGDGVYVMSCVPPGLYKVVFMDEGPLDMQYYPRTGVLSEAAPVLVAPGDTTREIDFEPPRGIALAGRLTDRSTGKAIPQARVLAVELGTRTVVSADCDQDGGFRLERLGEVPVPNHAGSGPLHPGLPAGRWRILAAATVVSDPALTPIAAPSVSAASAGDGAILVEWQLPSESAWFYRLRRESPPSTEDVVLAEAEVEAGTDPLRTYLDRPPSGTHVYRLDACLLDGGRDCQEAGEFLTVRSDPVQVAAGSDPTEAVRIRVSPQPWDGRAPLRFSAGGELPSGARLHIFTSGGARIAGIPWPAGSFECAWNGLTAEGRRAPSGVYLWRLEGAAEGARGTLLLIR
jgi:hypothetical protein